MTRLRRLRRSWVLLAALPAILLTIPLFDRDGAVAGAIASAIANPASIFAARSPGAREAGALTQTKVARQRVLGSKRPGGHGPQERVLSQIRNREPAYVDGNVPGAGDVPFAPVDLPDALAPDQPFFTPTGGRVPVPSIADTGNPGGGGGGGIPGVPGPNVTPTPTATPTVVSPVPEPSTWAMIILGFMTIGIVLRRESRAAARRINAEPSAS